MMIQVKKVTIILKRKDQDLGQTLQIVKKKTLHGAEKRKNVLLCLHRPHINSPRDQKENIMKTVNKKVLR